MLQFKAGEIEIDDKLTIGKKIFIKNPDVSQIADAEYISEILDKYEGKRIQVVGFVFKLKMYIIE